MVHALGLLQKAIQFFEVVDALASPTVSSDDFNQLLPERLHVLGPCTKIEQCVSHAHRAGMHARQRQEQHLEYENVGVSVAASC